MELVAAADSDERGLMLLRIWNTLRSIVVPHFKYWIQYFFPKSKDTVPKRITLAGNELASDTEDLIEEVIVSKEINSSENETRGNEEISASETDDVDILQEESIVYIAEVTAKLLEEMPPIINTEVNEKVRLHCECLVLSDETLHDVCQTLNTELNRGLAKETNAEATIKCFPTFVQELPNGKESGRFLALDLGGTNFRVLLIELGEGKFAMDSKIYAVPHDIMVGHGTELFDHIAACMASFINERQLNDELLPLGFTFSFPCAQEGLTKARLARWTKGFKCAGVEGNDVVAMLKDAIARRQDVRIKICAVLNDTTGTLMSCAWKNHNCMIGLIVGTGTNACYMEKLEKVELWDGATDGPQQVIINTEWGAFGDNGCLDDIRVYCDHNIDKESINPGRQLFEKMISGMYMGEIARQVLVKLVDEGLIFENQNCDALKEKGQFFTKYISEIESDKPGDFSNCLSVLEDLGILDATPEDCASVRYVCEVVSRRAANLAGAGVAVLLNRIAQKKVTVAVDGSVYRFHPFFHDMMVEIIKRLVKPGIEFDLMLSEDGSGRGAALVAAVANRSAMERQQLLEQQAR
ncbi:hexokinase type 2 isoform X2 [Hyalella azteca]|uniref:Phosphotransferase n=1 Tax=Hyalella azteca TaxID=294128 RepID=A0A8B7NJ84_HYAAZ|nr:hexokinase type 2 isoform X2 [Hyalella azteca]